MNIACALLTASALGLLPVWEVQLPATPRGEAHIVTDGESRQILLIPLGSSGLGAWAAGGILLPGFPVSNGIGVVLRPAAVPGSTGETLICYADNDGFVHLIDLGGNESYGWPVEHATNVITSITATDMNDDGLFEITYGTSDGRVHLLDLSGNPLPGWPVNLNSQLQYQPTEVSLGGGNGNGLICATNNSKITVLDYQGTVLPGWPQLVGYPAGTVPVSGDVNGDGQADIVFATQDGKVHLYSILGVEQEGWPFYMDDRPVPGSCAIGLLDTELQLPQVAVASIDSMVYLLNGDGSLAGTWMWPNRTDSRPYQPIIVPTGSGTAVVTTTNSGTIYAWDASGRRISGYPVDNPGGAVFPPVAGDISGDGLRELIVVNPSGMVTAYPMSSYMSGRCLWPLPLGDQYNSGAYGTGFLPVAEVEQLSGEFSGSVSLSYSVSCTEYTGISVSYSTDAGFTWHDTRNYSERPGEITWDSEQDLPSADERRCLVRITPYSNFGPGESGTSGFLHIDNNRPPELFMETPEKLDDSRYVLGYAVEDREGDVIQLQGQYSIDGGNTWEMMHLGGSSIEIEPWFYGEPVTWNAAADIGHVDADDVRLRIRAADSDPGPWYFVEGLHVDTDRLPSAQIIAPTEEVNGRVHMGVRLSDPEQNLLDVAYEYSTNGGTSWQPATVIEAEQAGTARYEFEIIWESETDLPGYDGYQVRMRALPSDMNTGIAVPSAPFHVDNNDPPSIRIESPSRYDVFRGDVPVRFGIADSESDDVKLLLEYRVHGAEETWHRSQGLVSSGPFGISRYNAVLHWNSSVDLPGANALDVDIRLVAVDGDSVRSSEITPITIDNSNLPEVIRATISNMNFDRGEAEIAYELGDRNERVINLDIYHSTDGGSTWRQSTVSGSATGIYAHSYEGSFIWHYRTDVMGNRGTTILRITPEFEGGKLGRPRFIEQVFR